MSWRLFPCSNSKLGEIIQLEVLHSTFFSNKFWDFRTVNNLEIGLYTILRFLYDKRNLENDFEFWIQGKIWLTLLATQPSRNVNFDEAQTNDINVSKKRTFVGLSGYLTIYFFKSKTNDQNVKPTLKIL